MHMKKRIKNKLMKKNNTERMQEILAKIKEHFTLKTVKYGDGYFFMYLGQHSVCHFTLEETPEWTYAIWLSKEGFDLFGEYDDFIDKFKPSRTYINCGEDVEKFLTIANGIITQPKLYIVDALTGGNASKPFEKVQDGDTIVYEGYQVVREFNEETKIWDIYKRDESITQEAYVQKEYEEYMGRRLKREQEEADDRKYAFDFFKDLPNLFEGVKAVGVIDGNRDGWDCSPRYKLRILISEEMPLEQEEELFEELDKGIHKKSYSDDKKTYEHSFDLDGTYTSVADIKVCHYQFFKKEAVS